MSIQATPFTLDFLIRGYDCCYGGTFRFFSLANFFQEAAGKHAQEIGIGMEAMAKNGLTWMLSRIAITIHRLPVENEKVIIKTWPSGTEKMFANRDIVMETETGEILVSAVYAYIVVDIEKRKILRPILPLDISSFLTIPRSIENYSFKVPSIIDKMHAFTIETSNRHIDHNNHVNNAFTIAWLKDAIPLVNNEEPIIKKLTIEFKKEILCNDTLEAVYSFNKENNSVITNLVKNDDIVATGYFELG